MTKIFLTLAATLSLAACTTMPSQSNQANSMDPRTPAGIFQDSSAAAKGSMNTMVNASVTSFEFSKEKAILSGEAAVELANNSKDLVVMGANWSKDRAIVVFQNSKEAGKDALNFSEAKARASWHFAVTSTGKVIDISNEMIGDSINSSKSAIKVSVTISENVKNDVKSLTLFVWNKSKTVVIGTVKISEKAYDVVKNSVDRGAEFIVDQSGNLWEGSKNLVGQVVDGSQTAVEFVSDHTGKILTWSGDKSVYIVHGASDAMVDLGQWIWRNLKATPGYVVDIARASAQGSVVVIKASGKAFMLISDAIGGNYSTNK